MSGYKPGYSEEHSPYWSAGQEDGARDALLLSRRPPVDPIGPDEEKSWSYMYMRGYKSAFETAS